MKKNVRKQLELVRKRLRVDRDVIRAPLTYHIPFDEDDTKLPSTASIVYSLIDCSLAMSIA